MISKEKLDAFGASIDSLPKCEQIDAWVKYQKMRAELYAAPQMAELRELRAKVAEYDASAKANPGDKLWSFKKGNDPEIVGYVNCIVLPSGTVWGDNLRYKSKD